MYLYPLQGFSGRMNAWPAAVGASAAYHVDLVVRLDQVFGKVCEQLAGGRGVGYVKLVHQYKFHSVRIKKSPGNTFAAYSKTEITVYPAQVGGAIASVREGFILTL